MAILMSVQPLLVRGAGSGDPVSPGEALPEDGDPQEGKDRDERRSEEEEEDTHTILITHHTPHTHPTQFWSRLLISTLVRRVTTCMEESDTPSPLCLSPWTYGLLNKGWREGGEEQRGVYHTAGNCWQDTWLVSVGTVSHTTVM